MCLKVLKALTFCPFRSFYSSCSILLAWILPYKLKETSGSLILEYILMRTSWTTCEFMVTLRMEVSFSKDLPGSPNKVQHPALLKCLIITFREKKSP